MSHTTEYVKDQIWILEYPVRFLCMDLYARTTIIKLDNGDLIIHDPCPIDDAIKREIDSLGPVRFILAPGSYHYLFVTDFQHKYPDAETYLCPGLDSKHPDIQFDGILGNAPDPRWQTALDQVLIQGTRYICEVVFFHKPSGTLILVDLLENIGDDYRHKAGLMLRFWWKVVFRMWNNPKAAPEYQLGWGNKKLVKEGLSRVLAWKAQRVIIAHGENIEGNVNGVLRAAWKRVLSA